MNINPDKLVTLTDKGMELTAANLDEGCVYNSIYNFNANITCQFMDSTQTQTIVGEIRAPKACKPTVVFVPSKNLSQDILNKLQQGVKVSRL
jgi:hypothetical protein